MRHICIRPASWSKDEPALKKIRKQVFINEQKVPDSLEWDGYDNEARHWLAESSEGLPVGCVRLLPSGQIGRMAVIPEWRKKGVGSALLQTLIQDTAHDRPLFMHAQSQVTGFYQAFGFVIEGNAFYEAGIKHYYMNLETAVDRYL